MTADKNGPPTGGGRAQDGNTEEMYAVFYDKDGNQRQTLMGTRKGPGPQIPARPAAPKPDTPAKSPVSSQANSPEEAAEDIADLIERKFVALLKKRLTEGDGRIEESDIAEMTAEFRTQLTEIRTIFVEAVDRFAKAGQRRPNAENREQAFHRLMVHRFERRLVADKAVGGAPKGLSRRMLPGFFSMLSLMIGPDNIAKLSREADLLVARLKAEKGDAFAWADVYASKEGRQIALKAEILIARNFASFDKRIVWLIAFINGNLISVERSLPGADWTFTEPAARTLVRDLFSGVRAASTDAARRDALARSLGPETMGQLDALVAALG